MANIDGYSHTNGKAGVSASVYQQVDQQQNDFDRALKAHDQGNTNPSAEQAVQVSKPGNEVDAARLAARRRKVEQTARPEEISNKQHNHGSGGTPATLGRTLDIQA